MPYRRPTAYARNDALTPGNYSQLRTDAQELEQAFRVEHIGSSGEHNTPLIARTLGTVRADAGPAYSLVGFNGDASLGPGFNPAAGDLWVTLASGRYEKDSGPVMVQNASDRGSSTPCLSMGRWFDDTRVQVTSSYWSGTLGVSGSGFWQVTSGGVGGADDAHFHLGIHGKALDPGAFTDFGAALVARQGLRAGNSNTYVNQLIQGSANLENALRVGHSAGAHNTREIAKGWCNVQWTGSGFTIIDQVVDAKFDAGPFVTAQQVSTGIVDVVWGAPLASTNYQVFVDVDYSRLLGDPSADYFIACVPLSSMTTRAFRVYLYKRFLDGAGVEYFDRSSAVDFHAWVFDNH